MQTRSAYLIKQLNDTPDGDGTLLDHIHDSLRQQHRDGNVHDHHDLPLALIGGRSANIKGGRHIDMRRRRR